MGNVTVDFVARGEQTGTWLLILIEVGPWSSHNLNENLRRLQERMYGCVDAALDGQLAELYPETQGAVVIVRLYAFDLPQQEVTEFFNRFSRNLLQVPDYAEISLGNKWVRAVEFELNFERVAGRKEH